MKHLAVLLSVLTLLANSAFAADISLADLKKAIESKSVTVIDVTGTESYDAGHIREPSTFSPTRRTWRASFRPIRTL